MRTPAACACGVLCALALGAHAAPPTAGGKSDEPAVESGREGPRLGGGSTPATPPGSSPPPPGFFVDIVGSEMPLAYCRFSEPCDIAFTFRNVGASIAAGTTIPDPLFTIDGVAVTPSSVVPSAVSSAGWATSALRHWTARLTPALGDHEIRAVMPRLALEKEANNNGSIRPVTVGRTDMGIKLVRESVDAGLRYEVKAVVSNKGSVPTGPLSVIAVLTINHHASTPPTLDQCFANPGLSGCVMERHTIDALAPGDRKDWKIGGKVPATSSVAGRATVACTNPTPCADADQSNNSDTAHFGP